MADPAADGLIHVADYQWVTKDTTSVDADVERALDEALELVEDDTHRKLAYAQHTETLYVYRNGMVYPTNSPVASVSSPTNLASTAIQGAGVYLGVNIPTPAIVNAGDWQAAVPPQAAVTYMGGFQPWGTTDGPTPQLPMTLARVLCRVSFLILHPSTVLSGVPVGAKSASVGDVSISGVLDAFIVVDPSIGRDLKPYRKRQVRAWQRA